MTSANTTLCPSPQLQENWANHPGEYTNSLLEKRAGHDPVPVEKLRSTMTENTTARVSSETSWAIPVSCALRGGPRGFATLMVEQDGEEIVLDAQLTNGCIITLDEAGATALFDILGTWLESRDDQRVQLG